MIRDRHFTFWPASMLCLFLLSACEPTPEERLSRAEDYLAVADYRTAAIELQNLLQAAPDNARARLMLAQTAYQLGDFSGAVDQYERAIGLGKTDATTWIALGRALLSQGRAVDAFERVTPNLESTQGSLAVMIFLGDVQFSLKNMDSADTYYSKAMAIAPTSSGGLIGQAMIRANGGDLDEADRLLDTAAQHNPKASSVWLARGRIFQANRSFIDAASAFETAIQLQTPRTPLAEEFSSRVALVLSLIDSRQLESAGTQLDELRSQFPDHAIAEFLQGHLAFANGEFDKAQMALQDYLSQNSSDARGRAILGAINFSQDNLRQAEANLIAAVRANAGGDATRRLLAETRLRLDNPTGAMDILRSAADPNQTDTLYLSLLGRAQLAAGDDEAALEYFRRGVEQEPGNDSVTLALASTYLRVDRAEQAIEVLDEMPIRAGSDLRRQTLLIAALIRQGGNERAIAESNKLIGSNPDDSSAHVIAGAMWQALGAPNRASIAYERALALDSGNLAAQFSLSRMALANGEKTAAALRLESLLESNPAYVPAIVALGMIFQDIGSLDSLRPYLLRAIEAAPDSVTPHVILARLELTLGNPDGAIEATEAARSLFGSSPELEQYRGLGLQAKGELHGALRALMSAASAAPGNAAIQFDLAQAQVLNKRFGAAAESATTFCELMPTDSRCPILRGDIDLARGDGSNAVKNFEAASKLAWTRQIALRLARAHGVAGSGSASAPLSVWLNDHQDDHGVRAIYARLLESEGDTNAAISEYEVLYVADELGAVGMNNLAWHYAERNDVRAVDVARQAHALAPDNGSITDTLGWILARRSRFDEAVPLLREATRMLPGVAEVKFHLASALASKGEAEEARRILSELLNSNEPFPSRSEARQILDTL